MWDGSAVPLEENLQIARELLEQAAAARIILEIEVGVVGGEEDGVVGAIDDKLYSTPEDALATAEALGLGENGRYLTALTFGNVHGVYKPGNVKLRPEILKQAQDAVVEGQGPARGLQAVRPGLPRRLRLARRGDRGRRRLRRREDERRHRHPVRLHPPCRGAHVRNYDGVLKVDGEVGNKKLYDPRAWGKAAEAGMAARVVEACQNLRSAGQRQR